MNVLFVTLVGDQHVSEGGIYSDLMRTFNKNGHDILYVSPTERRRREQTHFYSYGRISHLRVKSPNIQKTNWLEKGISTLVIEFLYLFSIIKYFGHFRFDLIIYSTPPITFTNCIKYIKRRDSAKTYLLLKDIFPQNAIDMGLMKRNSLLHRYFKRREKKLYQISDYIGCMSPANVWYMNIHYPYIRKNKVEVNPNSLDPRVSIRSQAKAAKLRMQYGIPLNATVFIYGGNLGVPQGLHHLIDILESNLEQVDKFFVIVGEGTYYDKLLSWFDSNSPSNAMLLARLDKSQYDSLVKACDVGLIFLDSRFTIPNYPSRLLSYMEAEIPILMAIDAVTDIGAIAQKNNYGMWCLNGDTKLFNEHILKLSQDKNLRKTMGSNGYKYMLKHYTVERSYDLIMRHFSSV